jgi:hypothetical protein
MISTPSGFRHQFEDLDGRSEIAFLDTMAKRLSQRS